MKYLLSLVLLTTLNVISLCQVKPEAFIGMLPAIPGNACADDIDDKNIFFDKLDSMSELIENELANREEESDADSEELENEAMKNLANKYGLSQEELEQLQNDENLSEEEQEELINKVMKKKDDDKTFRKGIDDLPTVPIILSEWTNLNPDNINRMLHNANDWSAPCSQHQSINQY